MIRAQVPRRLQGGPFPDAGQQIGQGTGLARGIVDIRRRDRPDAEPVGQPRESRAQEAILRVQIAGQFDPEVVAVEGAQPARRLPGPRLVAGQQWGGEHAVAAAGEADEPGGMGGQESRARPVRALCCPPAGRR